MRFPTYDEAADYVRDLATRWTWVTATRVTESNNRVNYRYIDGQLLTAVPDWIPYAETTVLNCN